VILRRTVLLAALVLAGVALVLVVPAPVRRTGPELARGHRVLGIQRGAVQALSVALGGRRFDARRAATGWEIDGRPASAGVAGALDDLTDALTGLRAIDVFRTRDAASYGLDRPRATIDVTTARGRRGLVLGDLNTAGSAVYARREGDPRILQVGTLVLDEIERVLYHRDAGRQRPVSG
jgi:hypothetical protein